MTDWLRNIPFNGARATRDFFWRFADRFVGAPALAPPGRIGYPDTASLTNERRDALALRTVLTTLGVVAAIWLAADLRWVFTDTVVPWDSKNQFYAFFRFLASSIHEGSLPFWNPYHYGGHPSVADPQSLVFVPSFVLWALFDKAPSLRAFDLVVYVHLLVSGLAVAVIGLRARWPLPACVLAAAVFMFGAAAAGRLEHTGLILSYSLFPPALLLLQLTLQRRSLLAALGFVVVAAVLLLGRNQVALLMCFLLAAIALAEIATAPSPLVYLRARLPVLLLIAGLGVALIAVPLLLTLQFAALSNRPVELLSEALKGSLYPANLANLMVPDIFGTHSFYWGPDGRTLPEVGYTDDSFNYLFVGTVPMVLLLWFGIVGRGVWKRGRILFAVTTGVALIYMLGRYTPLFPLAFEWVPGVAQFRRPVDGSFVITAMLALLCGHLLADYIRNGLPPHRWRPTAAVIGVVLVIVASAVVFSHRTGHGADALWQALLTAPIVVAVILVLALARTASTRATAAMVVTAVAVGELLWWNVAFRLNAEPRASYAVLEHPVGADARALDALKRAIHSRQPTDPHPRVEVLGLGGPWQNLPVVWGLEATNGYNPLRIGFYDRLVSPGEENWVPQFRDFPPTFAGYDCALARALGLEYLIVGRPIDQIPHLTRIPAVDVVQAGPPIWIYRLHDPMPRVTFTDRVRVVDADAVDPDGELLASPMPGSVLVDDDTPPSRTYTGVPEATRARIVSWRNDAVEIEAESDRGGVLVLHAPYYPGWVATVDGRRTRILRADVLFRGVEVPAGRHKVRFEYHPFSFENLADALKRTLHRHG